MYDNAVNAQDENDWHLNMGNEGLVPFSGKDFSEEAVPTTSNKQSLKKEAEKTSSTLQSTKDAVNKKIRQVPGLEVVMEILDRDEELKNRGGPPPWGEVVGNEDYAAIIDEVDSIVRTYINKEFTLVKAQEDIVRIASFIIYLSSSLGKYQAQASEARSRLENFRTKAYIKAKKTAMQEGAKLTDTDAKELANYYSISISEELAILEFIEKYLSNAYYSVRLFLEQLNFVTGREAKLKNAPGVY